MSRFHYQWSRPFDVHRVSDHPAVQQAIDNLLAEVLARRTRVRDRAEIRKHLVAVVLDLYVASIEQPIGLTRLSPRWIGISRGKRAYQGVSRYRKLYLSYRHLIAVIDDLRGLKYVKQRKGFFDRRSGRGYLTRVRARSKLLAHMAAREVRPEMIVREEPEDHEVIILKDSKKKWMEYEDDESTNRWRTNLQRINRSLSKAELGLFEVGWSLADLNKRLLRDPEHRPVDYGQNQLKRIFNNGSFAEGGRFYGGWWQNIPREFRQYIRIGRAFTTEIDYSGYHVRMLYADKNLDAPDDPYDVPGVDREVQKLAMQILINAEGRGSASAALARKGIKPKQVVPLMKARHAAIADSFHTGMGTRLQFRDSRVAEQVMLSMLDVGVLVLPVHDSFIVPKAEEEDLEAQMDAAFVREFPGQRPVVKHKLGWGLKPNVWEPGTPIKWGDYVRPKHWGEALSANLQAGDDNEG